MPIPLANEYESKNVMRKSELRQIIKEEIIKEGNEMSLNKLLGSLTIAFKLQSKMFENLEVDPNESIEYSYIFKGFENIINELQNMKSHAKKINTPIISCKKFK
jgi:hypothetical protein